MTRTRLTHVFRTCGPALLPAVLLLCCAGRADAGCGDYVRIIGPDGKVRSAEHPTPAESPCQGPECTGGPKAPPPIPAPTSLHSDGKAVVIAAIVAYGTDLTVRPTSEIEGLPVRRATSIFHPPRAS